MGFAHPGCQGGAVAGRWQSWGSTFCHTGGTDCDDGHLGDGDSALGQPHGAASVFGGVCRSALCHQSGADVRVAICRTVPLRHGGQYSQHLGEYSVGGIRETLRALDIIDFSRTMEPRRAVGRPRGYRLRTHRAAVMGALCRGVDTMRGRHPTHGVTPYGRLEAATFGREGRGWRRPSRIRAS